MAATCSLKITRSNHKCLDALSVLCSKMECRKFKIWIGSYSAVFCLPYLCGEFVDMGSFILFLLFYGLQAGSVAVASKCLLVCPVCLDWVFDCICDWLRFWREVAVLFLKFKCKSNNAFCFFIARGMCFETYGQRQPLYIMASFLLQIRPLRNRFFKS